MPKPSAALSGRFVSFVVMILVALSPSVVLGQPIQAGPAAISEATVYLSGAEIVRELQVRIPKGASTIEIAEFPAGVVADAIRASTSGVPSIVRSITVVEVEPEENPPPTALELRILELEDQIYELGLARGDDTTLRGYLSVVANSTGSASKSEDPTGTRGGPDAAAIASLYELLDQRSTALSEAQLERRKVQRQLDRDLARAKKEREEEVAGVASRIARVQVEADQAGSVTLALRYFVAQAGWRPKYRGTLGDDNGFDLFAEAAVRQWTDEPWENVHLKLSTVRPSTALSPPSLETWQIKPWEPQFASRFEDHVEELKADAGQQRVLMREHNALPAAAPPARPARVGLESSSTQTSFSVTYDVPGLVTIAGEGEPRQIAIWNEVLASIPAYRTKPSIETAAYLEATVKAPREVPVLAGELALYSGNTRIGSHSLPETGPGETRIIPFGSDPRIKVERVTRDISEGRQGIVRKQQREQRAYRTKITNHRNETVKVIVEDRLPVADDERIVVSLSEDTTPGHKPSLTRRGVILWTLDIAPGDTAVIDFGFTVLHSPDFRLEGLDDEG